MFLDSAEWADSTAAAELGYVSGITTNPLLFSRTGCRSPLDHLNGILERFTGGTVLYQPCALEPDQAGVEARQAHRLDPSRVGIKLLASRPYYQLASSLIPDGVQCAMTAVYSPAQAVLAHDVGCRWVIPYVDRSQRLLSHGENVVRSIRAVLDAKDSTILLLAASIKSVHQAVQAILDGADDVSAPQQVLKQMAEHDLTATAAQDFASAAQTLLTRPT
jgi:transaldolase